MGKLASFSVFNSKDLLKSSEKASEEQYEEDNGTLILVNFMAMENHLLFPKLACHMSGQTRGYI